MRKSIIASVAVVVGAILLGGFASWAPGALSPGTGTTAPATTPAPPHATASINPGTPAPVPVSAPSAPATLAPVAKAVVPVNVVRNPSFAPVGVSGQGLFVPWWLQIHSGAAATLHVDKGALVPGATAARVDIARANGVDWGVQLEQHIPTAAGGYAIAFWVRASSPQPLRVALQQTAAPYALYFTRTMDLTTAWQRYTLRYDATATDGDTFFAFNLGIRAGAVWIGDVTVTTIDARGRPHPTPAVAPGSYFRGLNLKGSSTKDQCCAFAPPATLDWARSEGFNIFRVPFAWAHLQPAPGGPLDPAYLGAMDALVAAARARGQRVAFVPMDRREAPVAAFVDLWTRLAQHYKDEPAIWGYDLMNEPVRAVWNTDYLPRIIAAIRSVDMIHTLVVESSTGGWGQYWDSHTAGLPVRDPADNVLYEAHFYFDTPANGRYPQGTAFAVPNDDLNIGVERATDFVNWCNANGVRCYAGEYGIPGGWTDGNATCTNGTLSTDPHWLAVLDRFLTYLDQNHISGTYWEAGPFGDVNDLGPTCSGRDRPQLAILQKHPGRHPFNVG